MLQGELHTAHCTLHSLLPDFHKYMAEQGDAEPDVSLKKALHWTVEEVDRLAICWVEVSTEKGGVGSSQRLDGMWKKITHKYHNEIPPPPVPKDILGNECLPRNENSLVSKWRRTRTLIAKYMKCHMLALSHPLSGEDAQGLLARTMTAFRRTEIHDFPFISTYNILKDEPKWHLDVAQMVNTVNQQTGAAKKTVIELLAREAEKEPTVVGTRKPEGQKKARRTMTEMSAKDKEIEKEEAELSGYLDAISQRSRISIAALARGSDRTKAIRSATDDKIMFMNTTGMDAETLGYHQLRRKHALEHVQQVEENKEAERNASRKAILAMEALAAAADAAARAATECERRVEEEEEDGDEETESEENAEGFNGSQEEFDARVRS